MPSTKRAAAPAGGLLLFLRVCIALAVAMISVPLLVASSASADPDVGQVVVCKYTSTPVTGEIAHHIVINSANALEGDGFDGTFPFFFSDAQNQSIAIRYAEEGEQSNDLEIGECPPFPGPEVCPEGTDHAGEEIPEGETAESFCNDEEPPAVCPEGTDNAGQEIPEGETEESFCNEAPEVCPEGTDNAGQEIPEGETAESFCNEGDNPPEPIIDPPPAPPAPPETPTLPNTGSPALLSSLGLMGALLLAAGSTLLMRARRIRVPKA
jgi:LPXTG-motif cell wall-anchored protein